MVELGEHDDGAANDAANDVANLSVIPAAYRPAASASSGMWQAQLA